jgi:hypothetical protein
MMLNDRWNFQLLLEQVDLEPKSHGSGHFYSELIFTATSVPSPIYLVLVALSPFTIHYSNSPLPYFLSFNIFYLSKLHSHSYHSLFSYIAFLVQHIHP